MINEEYTIHQNKNIIRSDYITRTFIKYIVYKDFNKNMHLINYNFFVNYEKKIIKSIDKDINEEEIKKYVNYLDE